MSTETLLLLRFLSSLFFAATLVAGACFVKQAGKSFGRRPALADGRGATRSYAQIEAFVLLVHALLLTGGLTVFFFA
jgi:hypothetical protein